MSDDKILVGTEFYKKKGYVKALTIHLTEKLYEELRKRAFREKASLQVTARKTLERGLQK